jgi:hypothetical protein
MHWDYCIYVGISSSKFNNNNNNTCRAKGREKEVKIQGFGYRDTTNVEPEMYDYTSNKWSHWKSLRKNLEAVPGKQSIDSLQKTAILGISHIIRKVLQCEV